MKRRTFIGSLMALIVGLKVKLSAKDIKKGRIHGVLTITKPPMILTLSKVVGAKYVAGQSDPRVFEVVSQLIRARAYDPMIDRALSVQEFAFNNLLPGVYRVTVGDKLILGFDYHIDDLEIAEGGEIELNIKDDRAEMDWH